MNSYDFSTMSSGKYNSLNGSIEDARTNKITLDNISNHYIFEEEVHMSFSIMRKYEHIIRANVELVDLPKNFYYRPEYLCYEYYKTTDLWYLILFVNNMTSPSEFIKEKVYIVKPEFIDTFIKIIEKEKKMINSRKEPTLIYKHALKSLNSPSKQVLPSDFDAELDDLTNLKDYEDVTDDYIKQDNFIESGINIVRGKLLGDFFELSNRGDIFVRKTLCNSFEKIDSYKDIGENIRIVKSGYMKVDETGNYKFKVLSDCDFQMYLDDKVVLNHIGENTKLNNPRNKNLIEEYSLNSDFKRRNLDFWDKSSNSSLIYSDELNKNLLEEYIKVNDTSNYKVLSMTIPRNEIIFENNGEFIFDVEYYVKNSIRYHKLVQEISIDTTNGIKLFTSETEEYNASEEGLQRIRLIADNNIPEDTINSVTISLYVKTNVINFNNTTVLQINKFKLFTLPTKEHSIYLDSDKVYKFKSILTKNDYNSSTFRLLWCRENEEIFNYIHENNFYIEYPYSNQNIGKKDTVAVKVYKDDLLSNQYLSNKLFTDNASTKFLGGNKFMISFTCENDYLKTNIKLEGINSSMSLYCNGDLLGTKDSVTPELIVDTSNTTSNNFILEVIVLDGYEDFSYNISREINGIYELVETKNLTSEFNKFFDYSISSHNFNIISDKGNTHSLYHALCSKQVPNDWILDMSITGNNNMKQNGLFGIIFDMKDSQHYYSLILKNENFASKTVKSGIYKFKKDSENILYDDTFKHEFLNGKMTLMEELDILITRETKDIKILKKDGRILLCQDGNRYPFKNILDMFEPYMDGYLGFMVYEQDGLDIELTLWA